MRTVTLLGIMGLLGTLFGEGEPLEVGTEAPRLHVSTDAGETLDLGQAYEEAGWVLVYFYPKADTPGCTAQACSLRDAFAELTDRGVTVYGASLDSVEAQAKFRAKYALPFPLIADTKGELAAAFGVPVRAKAFASRQAFLIREGKIVWRDTSASTRQQADDVLKAISVLDS